MSSPYLYSPQAQRAQAAQAAQIKIPKQSFFKHHCELRHDESHTEIPPNYTRLQKFCWKLKQIGTVRRSTYSLRYLRSNFAHSKEKKRHLSTQRYKKIIHPFSLAASIENVVMFFVWSNLIFMCPFRLAFYHRNILSHDYQWFKMATIHMQILRALLLCDVIFRFFLGYVDRKTHAIVLEPKLIAKRYLKTHFIFDIAPCTGIFLFVIPENNLWRLVVYMLSFMSIARVTCAVNLFGSFLRKLGLIEDISVCIRLSLYIVVCLHWSTCFLRISVLLNRIFNFELGHSWYGDWLRDMNSPDVRYMKTVEELDNYIKKNKGLTRLLLSEDLRNVQVYLINLASVLCHFFGARFSLYASHNAVEQVVLSVILVFGLLFHVFSIGRLMQFLYTNHISESEYEKFMYQAQQYMMTNRYPKELRRRIYQYYDYRFNNKFFNEARIMGQLTEHLRMEVILYSCKAIKGNLALKILSKGHLGAITALVKAEIYLPGDLVMETGIGDKRIFFISAGTCAFQRRTGEEVMHQSDGNAFVDDAEFSRSTVIDKHIISAIEPCEIFILKPEDLEYIANLYPDILQLFAHIGSRFARLLTRAVTVQALSDTDDKVSRILTELRYKKILEKRRDRETFNPIL